MQESKKLPFANILICFLLALCIFFIVSFYRQRNLISDITGDFQNDGFLLYEDGKLVSSGDKLPEIFSNQIVSVINSINEELKDSDPEGPDTEDTNSEDTDSDSEIPPSTNLLLDKDISDVLSISDKGKVDWATLTGYPTGCQNGQVVQVIGDTLTCTSILDWSDDEISNILTISDEGSVNWAALGSYPTGCNAGQAIQIIGDTLTCIDIGGSPLWTDGGAVTYITSILDDLAIGGTDNTSPFYFDTGLSLLSLSKLSVDGAAVFNEDGNDSDFRIEGNTEDHLFTVDAGTDEIRLGDWDTNYAKFAKDGEFTLVGTSRVIVNQWIGSNTAKAPGSKPATFVESGLTGVWQFDDAIEANQEQISGTIKIPAEMDRIVTPTFTVGWSTTTIYTDDAVDNETAEWQLEYLWIAANEDTTAVAQETLAQTTTLTAATPAEGLVFTSFSGIDLPDANDLAMFFRITRLSAGNDTIVDTLELRGMTFTFTKDKLGTPL